MFGNRIMNCERAKKHLGLYKTGDIEPSLALAIEQHLAGCAHCTKERETVEQILGNMPQAPKLSETYWESYTDEIMERIRATNEAPPIRLLRGVPAFSVGLALVTSAVFYKIYKMKETRENEKTAEVINHLEVLDNLNLLDREDFDQLAEQVKSHD